MRAARGPGGARRERGGGTSAGRAATPPGASAARDPAGFRGTVSITHTYAIQPVPGLQSTIYGNRFEATYRLHGGRWRSRFAPPRSYILTGRGHEDLGLHRTDLYQNGPIHERTDLFGRAFGNVRIVRRPSDPAEAGALLLRLLPHGRFTLSLSPLRLGDDGLRLNFELLTEGSQPCESGLGGTMGGREIFNQGVYEVIETDRRPGAAPFPGRRVGKPYTPTIWGIDIWNPPELSNPQPDVYHGRILPPPGVANATICGRYRRGRIAGKTVLGGNRGYVIRGICVFCPLGTRLPEPDDGIWEACLKMDPGAWWRVRTVFRWSFAATR
jgi:hypothetical protein